MVTYNHDEYGLFLQGNSTFSSKPANYSTAVTYLATFLLSRERTQQVLNTPELGFSRSLVNSSDGTEHLVQFTTDYWYRCNGEIYASYLEKHNKDVWELTWEVNLPQFVGWFDMR